MIRDHDQNRYLILGDTDNEILFDFQKIKHYKYWVFSAQIENVYLVSIQIQDSWMNIHSIYLEDKLQLELR